MSGISTITPSLAGPEHFQNNKNPCLPKSSRLIPLNTEPSSAMPQGEGNRVSTEPGNWRGQNWGPGPRFPNHQQFPAFGGPTWPKLFLSPVSTPLFRSGPAPFWPYALGTGFPLLHECPRSLALLCEVYTEWGNMGEENGGPYALKPVYPNQRISAIGFFCLQ